MVLMRLGAFFGFATRSVENSGGTEARRGQGWRPKKGFRRVLVARGKGRRSARQGQARARRKVVAMTKGEFVEALKGEKSIWSAMARR